MRTSVGPHGDADLAAAAFLDARQRDAQLDGLKPRIGASGVERAGQSHAARETPECPLGEVKGRVTALARRARAFTYVVQPVEQAAQVVVHVAAFEKDASHHCVF